MAVQLNIPYETLIDLIEQLSEAEKQNLIQRLQQPPKSGKLTAAEKRKILKAAQIHVPMAQEPSVRREDWYD